MLTSCSQCRKMKPRYNKGNGVFTEGPGGVVWKGSKCRSCYKKSRNVCMRSLRKKLSEEEVTVDLNPLTHRVCRGCKEPLRADTYFRCSSCSKRSNFRNSEGQGYYGPNEWGYGCIYGGWLLGKDQTTRKPLVCRK